MSVKTIQLTDGAKQGGPPEAGRSVWLAVAILLAAAVLRLAWLELRPPHHDEGADGWQALQIDAAHGYAFHAGQGHGPLHFYLLWASQRLGGRNLTALRLPDALASLGSVALTLAFGRWLGRAAARWAAAAMALSPGFTYFGRDAIHESELVFFLLLALWGALGLWQEGRRRHLFAAGLGATGCLLTKETAWLHFAAFGLAALASLWLARLWPAETAPARRRRAPFRKPAQSAWIIALTVAGGGALLAFFYTGHGTRPEGIAEFFAGPFAWLETGRGSGHEKPWSYWPALLVRYEWPCLIGLLAAPLLLWRSPASVRFLAAGTMLTLAAYTLMPYKTPWCLTAILAAAPLLFGVAISSVRMLLRFAAALALLGSLGKTMSLNFFHPADPRENYAYVQTSPDIWKMTAAFDALRRRDPHALSTRGKVFLAEAHPIPWLLYDFPYVNYFTTSSRPERYDSGFLLVEAARVAEVEARLQMDYTRCPLALLPDEPPAVLYLRREIFAANSAR